MEKKVQQGPDVSPPHHEAPEDRGKDDEDSDQNNHAEAPFFNPGALDSYFSTKDLMAKMACVWI